MDAEQMTADQLMELAQAKAGGDVLPAAPRSVTVDGLEVHIYDGKLNTWESFKLLRAIREHTGDFDIDAFDALMAYVEHVTDATEERIVEHCGGADAPIERVVSTVAAIAAEITPKK